MPDYPVAYCHHLILFQRSFQTFICELVGQRFVPLWNRLPPVHVEEFYLGQHGTTPLANSFEHLGGCDFFRYDKCQVFYYRRVGADRSYGLYSPTGLDQRFNFYLGHIYPGGCGQIEFQQHPRVKLTKNTLNQPIDFQLGARWTESWVAMYSLEINLVVANTYPHQHRLQYTLQVEEVKWLSTSWIGMDTGLTTRTREQQ